ncbi:MAG: HEAT repeat domain-containing protein, partial [Cyanobacteria bacterium P01_E01_bin.42]
MPENRRKFFFLTFVVTTIVSISLSFGTPVRSQESEETEIKAAIEQLSDPEKYQEAIYSLEKMGVKAVPDLIKAIENGNQSIRVNSIHILHTIGINAEAAIPSLLKTLAKDKTWEVRRNAAFAIGEIGLDREGVTQGLLNALQDDKKIVQYNASIALGKIDFKSENREKAIAKLHQTLFNINQDTEIENRYLELGVAYALVHLGVEPSDLIPILIKGLEYPNEISSDAIKTLTKIHEPAVDALIDASQNPNKIVRRNSVIALGDIQPVHQNTLSLFVDLLEDPDYIVRQNSALFISRASAANTKNILDTLIKTLENEPKWQVRQNLVGSLSNFGSNTKSVVPLLIKILEDENERSEVKTNAALSLGQIGQDAKNALPTLIEILKNKKEHWLVRQNAASALSKIGMNNEEALPVLIEILENKNEPWTVRQNSASAIGSMGSKAKSAIPILAENLEESKWEIRSNAALSLGQIGKDAKDTIPMLTKLLDDSEWKVRLITLSSLGEMGKNSKGQVSEIIQVFNHDEHGRVRANAARTLAKIFEDDLKNSSTSYLNQGIQELEKILLYLEQYKSEFVDYKKALNDSGETVAKAIESLKTERDSRYADRFFLWLNKYPWLFLVFGYILVPVLNVILFGLRPLWLLKIHNSLPLAFRLQGGSQLGGLRVFMRWILWTQLFAYRPKVLDAWIDRYIESARERFQEKNTVKERHIYIPLQIKYNQQIKNSIVGRDLQAEFNKARACLLIYGEGGIGKTSLACQIAQWSMSENSTERIAKHKMIPLLLEENFLDIEQPFLEAVRGQLQELINDRTPIPDELLNNLLQKKRLLVIVDRLSELSNKTQEAICPDYSQFPANALIVTSRFEEKFGNLIKSKISPCRLEKQTLSFFMESYLKERGERALELFSNVEFFNACRDLCHLLEDIKSNKGRSTTALFVKLYAEVLISKYEERSQNQISSNMPCNIADLMFEYINQLNQAVEDRQWDNREVQKDIKAVAWECLQGN